MIAGDDVRGEGIIVTQIGAGEGGEMGLGIREEARATGFGDGTVSGEGLGG